MPDRLFDHADDLNAAFAAEIVSHLKEAMTDRGRASLVVSGGNTPAPLFSQLANTPIDWSHVTILLADERWVYFDHPDSNEGICDEPCYGVTPIRRRLSHWYRLSQMLRKRLNKWAQRWERLACLMS